MNIPERLGSSRLMRSTILFCAAVTAFGLPVWVLTASSATVPNTFVNGEIADADEVNENFAALKLAIDDNDGRVSTLESSSADAEARLDALEAALAGMSSAPSGSLLFSLSDNDATLAAAGYVRQIRGDVTAVPSPDARWFHAAVWTGDSMIVWGGFGPDSLNEVNTGGIYDPDTQQWTPTSIIDAPSPRTHHVAVWTGTEMLIWGGQDDSGAVEVYDGARYNPVSDTWEAIAPAPVPDTQNMYPLGVWTGTKLIVISGTSDDLVPVGGMYDPATDSWDNKPNLLSGNGASQDLGMFVGAAWTGTQLLIVNESGLGTIYTPATDVWSTPPGLLTPWSSSGWEIVATAVEDNDTALFLGANGGVNKVFAYDISGDTWTEYSGTALNGGKCGIWLETLQQFVVFGPAGTGAIFNQATDTWTPITSLDSLISSAGSSVVSFDNTAIIWGGSNSGSGGLGLPTDGGAIYDAEADMNGDDPWTPLSVKPRTVYAYRKQ